MPSHSSKLRSANFWGQPHKQNAENNKKTVIGRYFIITVIQKITIIQKIITLLAAKKSIHFSKLSSDVQFLSQIEKIELRLQSNKVESWVEHGQIMSR